MSEWSHVICPECFERESGGRIPVKLMITTPEPCCWCGKDTDGSIIRRADPKDTPHCKAGVVA